MPRLWICGKSHGTLILVSGWHLLIQSIQTSNCLESIKQHGKVKETIIIIIAIPMPHKNEFIIHTYVTHCICNYHEITPLNGFSYIKMNQMYRLTNKIHSMDWKIGEKVCHFRENVLCTLYTVHKRATKWMSSFIGKMENYNWIYQTVEWLIRLKDRNVLVHSIKSWLKKLMGYSEVPKMNLNAATQQQHPQK